MVITNNNNPKKEDKDKELKSVEEEIQKIINEQLRAMKRIDTQLQVKVQVWEKDIGHKLFNFHEGFETLPAFPRLVGSRKLRILALLLHS